MALIDLLYDTEGNFVEKDGDFDFRNANSAIMEDVLMAEQGHYKEFPSLGVGMTKYINSGANPQVIKRDITVGLKADIFVRPIIDMSEYPSKITIDNIIFAGDQANV